MIEHILALTADFDLSKFDCGNDDLTNWLKSHALHASSQGTRTYVATNVENDLVGYFSIAPHLIQRESVPTKVGRGAPAQIPAILLAKLAVDKSFRGRGVGAELLVCALEIIVAGAKRSGGKLIVVDAVDENAGEFYQHLNFLAMLDNESRLLMKISTAAKLLDIKWP